MTKRLNEITRRRALLVAQAMAQRDELDLWVQPWLATLSIADRTMHVARFLRTHPIALIAGAALLYRLGPVRWIVWAGRLMTGWQIYSLLRERYSTRGD